MSEKYNAALGAFNKIKDISGTLNIGIGTGSTTDIFTEHFLPKLREKIKYQPNYIIGSGNVAKNEFKKLKLKNTKYINCPSLQIDFSSS